MSGFGRMGVLEIDRTRPWSFKGYRVPPDVIKHAVWLYFRFTLSLRDVEEMLAQRRIEVSYETIPCWVNHFGPLIAANIRGRRGLPTGRSRLDETMIRITGKRLGCGALSMIRVRCLMFLCTSGGALQQP